MSNIFIDMPDEMVPLFAWFYNALEARQFFNFRSHV